MPEQTRRDLRYPVENRVIIELSSPEFGSNEPSCIVHCKTLDISALGLRVMLDQVIPVDAILQLAVELPAKAGTLFLVAKVRWCNPLPGTGNEPGWDAGLTLLDADDSDIATWVELVNALENSTGVSKALE